MNTTRQFSVWRTAEGSSGVDRLDGDHAALPAAVGVPDDSRNLCEQGVVLASPDVHSREKACAPLAHEDRAARNDLAREPLDAEPLGVRVASVARGALSLLVCHGFLPFDRIDPDLDHRLPMAFRPAILLPDLLLEHENLAAADLADDGRLDRDLREVVFPGADAVVPRHEQHVGEREFLPLRDLLPGRLL